MHHKKRLKKTGLPLPTRGIRLVRKRRFEPTLETASGLKVRSSYEKRCADFLFERGISFQYEPLMLLGGRQFRPDFYLPDLNLFLEICGYEHMPHYRDRVAEKKAIYDASNLKSLFISYNGKGSLEEKLEAELGKLRDQN